MAKNPLLQKKFDEGMAHGYNQGFNECKDIVSAHIAVKLERLRTIPGIGKRTMNKIVEDFQRKLSEEDLNRAEAYAQDLRNKRELS
jgi:Holliday junction resolvasome RuvABC DNA-binding subunit